MRAKNFARGIDALRSREWGRRVPSLLVVVSPISISHSTGGEGQPRVDRCVAEKIRAEHPRTRFRGREIAGDDERARRSAEEMRPTSGKDAERASRSATRPTEGAVSRSYVETAFGRTNKRGLLGCAAVCLGMLLAATPALALSKHTYSTSFSGEGPAALIHPTDVAVDQSTGDIYVVDQGGYRVEKFTPSGEFIFMVGQEVNRTASERPASTPTERDLCTAASSDSCQVAPSTTSELHPSTPFSGFLPGELANPLYVAVDNSGGLSAGDFYVASSKQGACQCFSPHVNYISKFDPSGHLISSWVEGGQLTFTVGFSNFIFHHHHVAAEFSGEPAGLAIDPDGDLYFSFTDFGEVVSVAQFGAYLGAFSTENTLVASRLAPAPGGDLLAATAAGTVHQLTPAGADLGAITGPGFAGPPTAIATDLSSSQTYVADNGARIDQFPPCTPSPVGCAPTDSFGSPQLVEATGLAVDESNGTLYAADAAGDRIDVFTPAPNLPDAATTAPTNPTAEGATMNGTVDPAAAGEVTACHFEYLPQSSYQAAIANQVQTLTFSGATGGAFNLAFKGQSTAATGSGDLKLHSIEVTNLSTATGAFLSGEELSGEGIAPGTTIVETPSGGLVLSQSATITTTGASLSAAIPLEARPEVLAAALQRLSTIGGGGVSVSGRGPYAVEFTGAFAHTNPPQLTVDASALTPPSATAEVQITTPGDDGWGAAIAVPCLNEAGEEIDSHPIPATASATAVHAQISALTAETTYLYRLSAANANGSVPSAAALFTPHHVVGLTTEPPTHLSAEAATLNASFLGNGEPTKYDFEWGATAAYGEKTQAEESSATGLQSLSFPLTALKPNSTYHYRIVAKNHAGEAGAGEDTEFTTPANPPQVSAESAVEILSESAQLKAQVNPGAADTVYHAEYGTAVCTEPDDPCQSTPMLAGHAGNGLAPVPAAVSLQGLAPATTYHYRIVAQNISATTRGPDRTFTTAPFAVLTTDPCPNAHVRQQTSAAGLLDCRAYELVSAEGSGGYDVASNLTPGQAPLGGYPEADGRVLYGVAGGGIPGAGHPTDRGTDPYLATRGPQGWTTEYVGIPATPTPSTSPFSSTLLEAAADLGAFAFGGSEICQPCFADGSTGIPLRRLGGPLLQGMAGSEDPGPSAEPAGYIAKHFSADGTHFLFGSKARFEPQAEPGQISIYDRDLTTEETHLVSKLPGGGNIPCLALNCTSDSALGALGISSDGSHILLGQLVEEQGAARHWHLYMNLGDSGASIELTPGATKGVLFDGMTADGEKVFFSSEEHLTGEDTQHTGPAIFMWSLKGEEEGEPLTLISRGDGSSCDPLANSAHPHWNVPGAEENCGALAIGGGGGVSQTNGTIYFLSPEQLDGSKGTPDAPNLYRAGPADAYDTHYVTTLESAASGPQPPKLRHTFKEDFKASPTETFTDATALAVEHEHGYVYVLDAGTDRVEKFDSRGEPVDFTAGAGATANQLSGSETTAGSFSETFAGQISPTALAVDPANGDLYVPDIEHGVIDKFKPTGELETAFGKKGQVEVGHPTAVAVDPTNGDLYVSGFTGSVDVFTSKGKPAGQFSTGPAHFLSGIGVDSAGTVYVSRLFPIFSQKGTEVFSTSGEYLRTLDTNASHGVAVDPSNGDVYVDEGQPAGTQIASFDSSGHPIETLSSESLSGSLGLAIDPEGNLYATTASGTEVAVFPVSLAPTPLIDNPAVLDSVTEPETRHTADFQLSPTGSFAAFPSTLALAGQGEETGGHAELYRYDASTEALACASCTRTGESSTADSNMAENGLSLTSAGQLFYTTAAALSPSDTDQRLERL